MGQFCKRCAVSTTDAKWPWAHRLVEEIDRGRAQALQSSKKERRLLVPRTPGATMEWTLTLNCMYDTLIPTPVLSSLGSSLPSALPISSPPSSELIIYSSSTTSPSPLMSSPFHPSHRRTRSHSSLSTPCTSPGPQQIQWRSPIHRAHACPKTIPCNVHGVSAPCASAKGALELSSQPPEKWDVDRWRRGKRARREPEVRCSFSQFSSSNPSH